MKLKCNFCGTLVDSNEHPDGFYEMGHVLYVFCPTCSPVIVPAIDAMNRKVHAIYNSNPVLRNQLFRVLNNVPHHALVSYTEKDATTIKTTIFDCGKNREVERVVCPGCLAHRQEGFTEELGHALDCKNTWEIRDGKKVQCCCFSGAHGYRK